MFITDLRKELQFIEDTIGIDTDLHCLKTKNGKEIDFLILMDNKPSHIIEVKWADSEPSKHISHFEKFLPTNIKKIQLVKEISREYTFPNRLEIRNLVNWLYNLELKFIH